MAAPRLHASMDQLCGLQQSLEVSMARHRDELTRQFGARLEHASHEAADTAVHRALEALQPRVEALEAECRSQAQSHVEHVEDMLRRQASTLGARLAGCEAEGRQLDERLGQASELLQSLGHRLEAEMRDRSAQGALLLHKIEELGSSLAKAVEQASAYKDHIAERLQENARQAAEEGQRLEKQQEQCSHSLRREIADQETRLMKRIEESSAANVAEAARSTGETATVLRQEIAASAEEATRQMGICRRTVEDSIKASAERLRNQCAVAHEAALTAASSHANEKAGQATSHCEAGVERAHQHAKGLNDEARAHFSSIAAELETSIADTKVGLSREIEALRSAVSKGDSARVMLRRGVQKESMHTQRARQELARTNIHAKDTLYAHIEAEIRELRGELGAIQQRCDQADQGLRSEVLCRPTKEELAETSQGAHIRCDRLVDALDGCRARLVSTGADLSARCTTAEGETGRHVSLLNEGLSTASGDIAVLRAGLTSLTRGVVKSLQIVGLLDDSPWARLGAPAACGGGSEVGLEDLLRWEKTGDSLASCVARQWRSREAAGPTTILAALDRRVQAEEHAVAKELIRGAAWCGRPAGGADAVQASGPPVTLPSVAATRPTTPRSSAAPVRQQRACSRQ